MKIYYVTKKSKSNQIKLWCTIQIIFKHKKNYLNSKINETMQNPFRLHKHAMAFEWIALAPTCAPTSWSIFLPLRYLVTRARRRRVDACNCRDEGTKWSKRITGERDNALICIESERFYILVVGLEECFANTSRHMFGKPFSNVQ